MKKFWLLALIFFPVKSHASLQDPLVSQEKVYVVHYATTVPANVTNVFDLIALSTTSSIFPHTLANPADTGEIDISAIHVVIDKVAAATTTIKVGVVTFVNTSTGSASYFFTRSSLLNVSNTDTVMFANYTPSFYRCKVRGAATAINSSIDGTTPFFLTNEKDSGVSTFNSTTTLMGPISSAGIQPRTGDILMKVGTDATHTVNIILDLWYHAEQ